MLPLSLPSRSMAPPEPVAASEPTCSLCSADAERACVTCGKRLCEDCARGLGDEFFCDDCAVCGEPQCAAQAFAACDDCGNLACEEHSGVLESRDEAVGYSERPTLCWDCFQKARRKG